MISQSQTLLSALFLALVLILPAHALWSRRLPASRLLKLALIWVAIFILVALIFGWFLGDGF